MRKLTSLLCAICSAWLTGAAADVRAAEDAPVLKLTESDGQVTVEVDGKLFTRYISKGLSRPVLYPVIGPTGAGMTRNWPLADATDAEAKDHPHHKSIWYNHGAVNGVDFWAEGKNSGKVVQDKILEVKSGQEGHWIKTANKWVDKEGKVICTDTRVVRFHAGRDVRAIDYEVTIHASEGKITLQDTKEGTMGIRTHPALRLKGKDKSQPTGKAVNSEGAKDLELWGKSAKWVDYWGQVDGKTVGVAMFDHPGNPRHPTTWHAREYGLVAANPFGHHDFSKGKLAKGAGDMTVEAGKSVTFKYRFVFHVGDVKQANIAGLYDDYAAGK